MRTAAAPAIVAGSRGARSRTNDSSLKVDFQSSRVTSDGGAILVRELDERLGLGKLIEEHLSDSRQGLNKKFPLADLLRRSVCSRLAVGWSSTRGIISYCWRRGI